MEALRKHLMDAEHLHMKELFAKEGVARFERFHLKFEDILVDFSKNRITGETFSLLMDLARERGVEQRRDAMFRGDLINITENRAVLHTALRGGADYKVC